MPTPNFLIIGAPKCGTTALYHYLNQHPQIYMSPVKEPNFFAFEGKKLTLRRPDSQQKTNQDSVIYVGTGRLRESVTDIESYRALFRGVSNEIAIGEASTLYLHSQRAPERIKNYIPEAKLIAILRNPIERAYSNYMMGVRHGKEALTDFAQALQEETQLCSNLAEVSYVCRGFYYKQLRRYFDIFSSDQIKVCLYEDLATSPSDLLRDIFQFLGVDESFTPDVSIKHNAGGIPQNRVMHRAFHVFQTELRPIRNILKQLLPERLYLNYKAQYYQKNLVKPQLSQEVRKQLLAVYREEILKLQDVIQRDLSGWLV